MNKPYGLWWGDYTAKDINISNDLLHVYVIKVIKVNNIWTVKYKPNCGYDERTLKMKAHLFRKKYNRDPRYISEMT